MKNWSDMPRFPHCDERILHAPGVCKYCDAHKDWQFLREVWGINFTSETDTNKYPCPADRARGDKHMLWPGNVAYDREGNPVIPPPPAPDVERAVQTYKRIIEETDV